MTKTIQSGDVVSLNSGGPTMTVGSYSDGDFTCQWFNMTGFHSGRFHPSSLTLVRREDCNGDDDPPAERTTGLKELVYGTTENQLRSVAEAAENDTAVPGFYQGVFIDGPLEGWKKRLPGHRLRDEIRELQRFEKYMVEHTYTRTTTLADDRSIVFFQYHSSRRVG